MCLVENLGVFAVAARPCPTMYTISLGWLCALQPIWAMDGWMAFCCSTISRVIPSKSKSAFSASQGREGFSADFISITFLCVVVTYSPQYLLLED